MPFVFFLGCPNPKWLEQTDAPLFVSYVRLRGRKRLPRARARWCLDSGAYTQITQHGGFLDSPLAYANNVRRYRDEVGNLIWAATQDWMTEPEALLASGAAGRHEWTRGAMREHDERTVQSFLELSSIAPDLPWLPTIQPRYDDCLELYDKAGVNLRNYPTVGVGSTCRLQAMLGFSSDMETLAGYGLNVHDFGVKEEGLLAAKYALVSSDSMAWSSAARWGHGGASECVCTHEKCNYCLPWALEWRAALLRKIGEAHQV